MKEKVSPITYLILFFKGALVGFGAILPGVSGGTLCVAFGMYRPIIDLLTHPIKTLKTEWLRLLFFILGGGIGFLGLAKLAAFLLAWNELAVTCVFVGFIIGTLPEIWRDAGEAGRKASSFVSLGVGFCLLLALLILLRVFNVVLAAGFGAWMLSGGLWGASFILPGLSSSNLIMFFGLYGKMMDGISALDFSVLFPLGLGLIVSVIVLPMGVNYLLKNYHSEFSHLILGFVLASTVMIVPPAIFTGVPLFFTGLLCVVGGILVSSLAGFACSYLLKKSEERAEDKKEEAKEN